MAHALTITRSFRFDALTSVADRVGRAVARHRAYRTTYNELDACTDRELNDIGISRYDIPRIASEAAAQV